MNVISPLRRKAVGSVFSPLEACSPVWTKSIPKVALHQIVGSKVRIQFEGETLSFNKHFAEFGILGIYIGANGARVDDQDSLAKKKATYLRVIKELDISDLVNELMNERIYKQTWVWVNVHGRFKADNALGKVKESLSKLANVRTSL